MKQHIIQILEYNLATNDTSDQSCLNTRTLKDYIKHVTVAKEIIAIALIK